MISVDQPMPRHSLILGMLIIFFSVMTLGITVEKGVSFDMTADNSFIYVGSTLSPSSATVYPSATEMNGTNISIENQDDSADVNSTLWTFDTASYDPNNREVIEIEERLPSFSTRLVYTNITSFGLSADQLILTRDGSIQKRITQGNGINWSHNDFSSPVNFTVYAAKTPNLERLQQYPDKPDFGQDVTVEANVSHPDNRAIEAVNVTVWAYNSSYEEQKIDNQNGTRTIDGSYELWNSSIFKNDIVKGTYNYSITVEDGLSQSTHTGQLFTSSLAPPSADNLETELGPPYNTASTDFRPGQTVTGTVDISDPNGRDDLATYVINLINPSGTTVETDDVIFQSEILNGYTSTYSITLPDSATTGTWTVEAKVTDTDGLSDTTSTNIDVTSISNTTVNVSYSLESGEAIVLGDSDYPYAIHTGSITTSGIVGYGTLNELVDSSTAGSWFSARVTQPLDSNTVLVPITEADQNGFEDRRQAFVDTTFLDYRTSSFGYELFAEKQVRVTLPYNNDDTIQLDGFTGSLGTGQHALTIRHSGETNTGATHIEVHP